MDLAEANQLLKYIPEDTIRGNNTDIHNSVGDQYHIALTGIVH